MSCIAGPRQGMSSDRMLEHLLGIFLAGGRLHASGAFEFAAYQSVPGPASAHPSARGCASMKTHDAPIRVVMGATDCLLPPSELSWSLQ